MEKELQDFSIFLSAAFCQEKLQGVKNTAHKFTKVPAQIS